MTAGLKGTGSEIDPWLIETGAHLLAVVRDSFSSGYYALTADISLGGDPIALTVTAASVYASKVLDGRGYVILGSFTVSADRVLYAGIYFKNVTLSAAIYGTGTRYLSYNCHFEDVLMQLTAYNAGTIYIAYTTTSFGSILGRTISRVVIVDKTSPGGFVNSSLLSVVASGSTVSHCFVKRNATAISGFANQPDTLTLRALDDLSGGAFSNAGWGQGAIVAAPFAVEDVSLTLWSLASGAPSSRRVWQLAQSDLRYVGETDAAGYGQFTLRLRPRAGFTLICAEDVDAEFMRAGLLVSAGKYYLPPEGGSFVYVAGGAGTLGALTGVTFDDSPVVISGVTFTPRPAYPQAVSERRSRLLHGASQAIELDTLGAGSVIDGDPAYLDGLVEEQHPTLGAIRPLANSEVAVFERRGDSYVAMGRALSNSIGEFRVETEVYGGGDVFAFAVDFPGVTWQPSFILSIGDRIRPTINNGYVYEVVSAGVSGATEPVWWADQGDGTEGLIGTARAKARPYYQPVGDGPRKMTLL